MLLLVQLLALSLHKPKLPMGQTPEGLPRENLLGASSQPKQLLLRLILHLELWAILVRMTEGPLAPSPNPQLKADPPK